MVAAQTEQVRIPYTTWRLYTYKYVFDSLDQKFEVENESEGEDRIDVRSRTVFLVLMCTVLQFCYLQYSVTLADDGRLGLGLANKNFINRALFIIIVSFEFHHRHIAADCSIALNARARREDIHMHRNARSCTYSMKQRSAGGDRTVFSASDARRFGRERVCSSVDTASFYYTAEPGVQVRPAEERREFSPATASGYM